MTATTVSATTYLNYPTTFLDGLTATTVSATTYYGDGSNLTGVGGQVEVTYSELVDKITGDTLTKGVYYLISDFKTCYDTPEYYINGSTKGSSEIDYKQGSVEPIIVLATSVNTISSTAYQPAYPNDRIQYDWTWNTTEITGGVAFGRITERIDEFNNRTDYDHRNILFNRFQSYNRNSQLTGVIISLGGSTLYGNGTSFLSDVSTGDILLIDGYQVGGIGVKVVSAITDTYLTIVTDPTFSGFFFCGNTYNFYSSTSTGNYDEYKEVYIGQKNEEAWDDFLTFNLNGTSVHNYVGDYSKFYLEGNLSNSGFLLANNVFFSNNSGIYSNIIGDRSFNNTGRYWFLRNTIAGRFYNNTTHQNGFYSNSIGEYFNNNIIKSSMYENVIKEGFEENEIYSQFYNNDIDNGFSDNHIYSSFYENKLGLYFESNKITQSFYINEIGHGFSNNEISGETHINRIGEQFEYNTIYGEFYDNQIFNEFKSNIIYQSFNTNRTDWGFGSNQFSGYCSGNVFGPAIASNDFLGSVYANTFKGEVFGNTIGNNFATNNIGFGFGYNIIGENFGYGIGSPQGNNIGNGFIYNTIGEYFYNNSIADNFIVNTIDNYFQRNIVNTSVSGVCLSTGMLYDITTVNVFKNKNGDNRLSYYDESDVLTIETLTEAPCVGGLNALDIPENDLNFGLMLSPTFTITSSDFGTGNPINHDTIALGGYGTDGFNNTASQGDLYQGYVGGGLHGTSLSQLTEAYNKLGFNLNSNTGYLWYVTWGSGSSINQGIVKFGSNVNGQSFDIQTIDTTDPDYLLPNGQGTSLVGTFLFPATFTIYYPLTNKTGWC